MKNKFFVITPSKGAFQAFCDRYGWIPNKNAIWINRSHQLRGYEIPKGKLIKTYLWWEIHGIKQEIERINMLQKSWGFDEKTTD